MCLSLTYTMLRSNTRGGDVLQSISNQFEKTGLFTERSAATMARHMLGCVLQLHERNVIHRYVEAGYWHALT